MDFRSFQLLSYGAKLDLTCQLGAYSDWSLNLFDVTLVVFDNFFAVF